MRLELDYTSIEVEGELRIRGGKTILVSTQIVFREGSKQVDKLLAAIEPKKVAA